MKKKVVGMIPVRMKSERFPGKPLAKILDLPMIEHVRRRALLCKELDEVYVATCDEEIKQLVESFGGKVLMTSTKHKRGTDRIEEATQKISDADIVVNIQGDEPTVTPTILSAAIKPLLENDQLVTTCVIYPLKDEEELKSVNVVKAVLSRSGFILYLSRSVIPNYFYGEKNCFYKQSGIMAFTKSFLHQYSKLSPTPLEKSESIDMLRVLEHDYKIQGVVVNDSTFGVDLKEHVSMVEKILLKDPVQKTFYERIIS